MKRLAQSEVWFPLSFAQRSRWFQYRMNFDMQGRHNNGFAARVLGKLEIDTLSNALSQLVARHPMLRTIYRERDGEPEQCVLFKAPPVDVSEQWVGAEEISRLAQRVASDFTKPFDLLRSPLIRATLYRVDSTATVMSITFDHIAVDGWSYWQLIDELGVLLQGKAITVAEKSSRYTYRDFVEWERNWVESEKGEAQWGYWQKQLEGPLPVLQLHTDRPRSNRAVQDLNKHSLELSASLTQKLRKLSAEQSSTLFSTLLAAYAILLQRHSGQDDIIIGVPMPGRTDAAWDKVVGDFVNPVAIRIRLDKSSTVTQALQVVRHTAMSGLTHQEYPFSLLVKRLHPDRALNDHPVYQTTFTFQKVRHGLATASLMSVEGSANQIAWGGVELEGFPGHQSGMGTYAPMALETLELNEVIRCDFKYAPELYDAASVERIAGHFSRLLHLFVADPGKRIGTLDILESAERHQLLVERNNTEGEYPCSSIAQLFEAQAGREPNNVALVHGDQQLTYAQLNERANKLAHFLRAQGVGPDVLVGICVTRSLEMMVGLIGVLKAGGAYMPLDPSYPPGRLAFMIDDAKPMVLLTQLDLVPILGVAANTVRTFCLDTQDAQLDIYSDTDPLHTIYPTNLAYVIYTSGSTGRPKGVCIEQQSAINLLTALQNRIYKSLCSGSGLRVGMNASISFDASVQQWLSLLMGATLYLIPEHVRYDPQLLASIIGPWQLDILDCTPSQLPLLLPKDSAAPLARCFLIGGEEINPHLWKTLKDFEGLQFYNVYGPTEATVDSLICDIKAKGDVPVLGEPINNTQIYLLDSELNPVPVGVVGEIHIDGVGLSRGYLNRPELTAQNYIPNPYSKTTGTRLYKTGDLARYLPDGNVEYLGRIDQQVKVRGYRIELGEIEVMLRDMPGVHQAALVASEYSDGDKRLIGYLVPKDGEEIPDRAKLRGELLQFFPDFMVPKQFVVMASLPLTPNGKVDRKALPKPDFLHREAADYVAPLTDTEATLASIWSTVLKINYIGREDDFFDLGGHSLLTTKVAARVRDVFKVELPLRTLFEHSQLRALAAVLDNTQRDNCEFLIPSLIVQARPPQLPLSYSQERLWLLEHIESMGSTYNISGALRFTGTFDDKAFEQSVIEIVRRHEPLRTRFEADDETIEQIIDSPGRFGMKRLDLTNLPIANRSDEAARLINEEANHKFDLNEGSLFRVTLLRLSCKEHVVVVVMHHIVSDGWSLGILVRELGSLYTAYTQGKESPIPDNQVQYADYVLWQRAWLQGRIIERQIEYWKNKLSGMPACLTLPLDNPRPPEQSFRGAKLSFTLPQALTKNLVTLAREENATLFMMLLAGFNFILSRWSDQEDIVIGTPVAGRTNHQIEGLIGLFVNILVLRTDVSGTQSLRQLVASSKETALQAYSHQDLPFERLVEEINPVRDLSRPPIFQVMINSITAEGGSEDLELPGLKVESVSAGEVSARFEMMLRIREDADSVTCFLEYATDLFDAATMERFATHYCSLLEQAVSAPDQPLSEFSLLNDTERRLILDEWNKVTPAPETQSVLELIHRQTIQSPSAIAIEYESGNVSYNELEVWSNRLARLIRREGVVPGSYVGLVMQASPITPVALLAIMKAGSICLPLDPAYPDKYLRELAIEGDVKLVLGTQGRATELASANCKAYDLAESHEALTSLHDGKLDVQNRLDSSCCLIPIWDSLGARKLIAMTHRGISQQVTAMAAYWKEGFKDHAIGFSPRICDLLLALLIGRLQLPVATVPRQGPEVKYYGLTQQVSSYPPEGNSSLMWRALPGVGTYVLDHNLELVSPHITGELYVDALTWSHGYLGHAALTAQDFVPSPFTAGGRIFRTGLRARWRSNGNLEIVGRRQQVWIKGHHVTLAEVEAVLKAHSQVKEGKVIAREDTLGQLQLVGYVSLQESVSVEMSEADWHDSLTESLPPHLIPDRMVVLKEMPRFPSGRIDLNALPPPARKYTTHISPQTPLEQKMAELWSEVLGVDSVSMDANFFDLGGHSLLATIMLARIRVSFGIELPLRSLFETASLRTFAELINQEPTSNTHILDDESDYEAGTI